MDSSNVWMAVIVIAWLLSLGSFLVYAYYADWLGYGFLGSWEKKSLYLLLRLSRTSALLFISVSVIAFLYFETDVFPGRIPDLDIQITQEQYRDYLKQRYQLIERQLNYTTDNRKEILTKEKSAISERMYDFPASYSAYAGWIRSQILRLVKARDKLPSRSLHRALKSLAAGEMLESDLAIEQLEKHAVDDNKTAAMLAFMRGSLAHWTVDYRLAYEHYARSARLDGDNLRFHREAAQMAYRMDDYKASLSHYESALAANLKESGENNPEVAFDCSKLGMVWKKLGDAGKASRYFEKALSIDLKSYPEDHPVIAQDYTDLGLALGSLKEYEKALAYFEKALAVNSRRVSEYREAVMINYDHLGWVWKKLDDHRRSAIFYEKALAIYLQLYGEDDDEAAEYHETLGWLWSELGERDRSLTHYERALGIYLRYGEQDSRVLRIRENLKIIKARKQSRRS